MQVAQLLLIRERTDIITQIMQARNPYGAILSTIEKELPDGLIISAYTFSDTTITITVSGDSLAKANTFLQNLTNSNKTNKQFTNIVLDSLVENTQTQKIDVTVHMTLL
jgi:Tfp pilus assembly protein PilN